MGAIRVTFGADHGGFDIKEAAKSLFAAHGAEVHDIGCHDRTSVDYPDFVQELACRLARRQTDQGVLVCTTGLGMSIAANRFPQVRAALCLSPEMARRARTHNNANVLVLAGAYLDREQTAAIVTEWTQHAFEGGRHERRLRKIDAYAAGMLDVAAVLDADPELAGILADHTRLQQHTVNLIASENYVSRAVRQAEGSTLTGKYAEGYPGKRWYNGCRQADRAEQLAMARARDLFGAEHANVQPHCGSAANMAVYFSVLKPGDTILSMNLSHGGHLTHGSPGNFSGRLFNIVGYGVDRETERIDYDAVGRLARECRPRMIVAGASAYPRSIDFAQFRRIADSVSACLTVDMAHIAGLVAGGVHPSPVPFADFVTTTTHKTLRGPRSGMVLCRKTFAADLDRQVFPGIQGGPMMHTIAAKALCLREAMQPDFKAYARHIVQNAARLAQRLTAEGFRLVSGGTDNHLLLVDLTATGLTGQTAAAALEQAGIIANKNTIPFDARTAFVTSGIRLGTPAATSRGMRETEMELLGGWIARVLRDPGKASVLREVRDSVEALAAAFPIAE